MELGPVAVVVLPVELCLHSGPGRAVAQTAPERAENAAHLTQVDSPESSHQLNREGGAEEAEAISDNEGNRLHKPD